MVSIEKILKGDRGLLLAYDHGFEYGPNEFNDFSSDPENIIKLADSGLFTGFICQKGIAAKYFEPERLQVPLIVKLNGKTSFRHTDEPISMQNCTVEEAFAFGASGVGYVIYVGTRYENAMIAEFARIEKEAHERGMFVICWMYVAHDDMLQAADHNTIAYAARLGLELNTDAIILRYTGDTKSFRWVVKNAGKCKVFVIGGPRTDTVYQILDTAKEIVAAGAVGFAIGRNIWQARDPERAAHQISSAVLE